MFGTITVQEATVEEATLEEAVDLAELQRESATARNILQRHQETINGLKTDNLKLWDQIESHQRLLERNEQTVSSLQTKKFKKLTKIANEGALFGLAGV